MPRADRRAQTQTDSIYAVIHTVGDAWSWLILREAILHGVERWGEFQRNLGLARETLASRLERLCSGGLLRREDTGTRFDVRYTLTPRGDDFFKCLATALRWGDEWCGDQGQTPLIATHQGCGAAFGGVLRCEACSLPLEASDIRLESISIPSSEFIGPKKRHRSPNLRLLERIEPCSIARAKMIDGDRWGSLVVRECFLGTRRFDDFATRLGVSTNILSNRLARLVELGVLMKERYQSNPPRSEYRLTPKGMAFYPIPLSMLMWGNRWLVNGDGGIDLRHQPCGAALSAALTCGTCNAPVARGDVDFSRPDVARGT